MPVSIRLLDGRCEFQREVPVEFGADSLANFQCESHSAFSLDAEGESARLRVAVGAAPNVDAGLADSGQPGICQVSPLNFAREIDAGVVEPNTTASVRLTAFVERGRDCVISLSIDEPVPGEFRLESTSTTQSSGTHSQTGVLSAGGLAEFRLSFTPAAHEGSFRAALTMSANGVVLDNLTATGRSPTSCPRRDAGCPVAELGKTYLCTDSSLFILADSGVATWLVDFIDVLGRPMSVKDIGILGDGTLVAVGGVGNGLFLVNPTTGSARLIASFPQSCNGLDSLPDGGVLIGGSSELFHYNLLSGTQTTIARFQTSGDVVSDGVSVFATSPSQAGTESILRVDLNSGAVGVLSDTGLLDGWGLVLAGQTLTMFTSHGEAVEVSTDGGAVLGIRALPGGWSGAARRE